MSQKINFDPRQQNNLSIILRTVLKHNPKAVSQEGIKKLVSEGYLSFEDAAECIDNITTGNNKVVMSVENVTEQNATDAANAPKVDDRIKELAFNPKVLKADIVINMTKANDQLLYQNYEKAFNVLDGTVKEMIEKVGSEFSAMMDHIDTLLDDGEKDKETFDAIRKQNMKLI